MVGDICFLSVAHSDARPTGNQEVMGLIHAGFGQHSLVEIAYEIFSMVIFSLRLIQERQLSVSGELMCSNTG